MKISEIMKLEQGNVIEGFYLIKQLHCKTANNNNKFLDLLLGDKTGEINAKLWDLKPEDENVFSIGEIVKVRATVTSWQNQLQLKIEKIRLSKEEDKLNIGDYVESPPFPSEYMYDKILEYISRISNKDIRLVAETLFIENKEKIMYYPAAMKNHHSIRSGLLYHILTMLEVAEKLSGIYTYINTDILYAGIVLHDIAKIHEMASNNLGIVSDYTVEGQLLGHITQAVKMIDNTAQKLGIDKEVSLLLQHMILSHHSEAEYGSPKKPMLPEAELLHHIDLIDSRMYDMQKALNGIKEGEFSEKIWSMDNRKAYKAKLKRYQT